MAGKLKLAMGRVGSSEDPSTAVESAAGRKLSDELLMQYRLPVGLGPSVNKWPRWDRQLAQLTSVLTRPGLAIRRSRLAPTVGMNFASSSGKGGEARAEGR